MRKFRSTVILAAGRTEAVSMGLNKRTQALDSDSKRTAAKPSTRHCVHASHLAAGIEE